MASNTKDQKLDRSPTLAPFGTRVVVKQAPEIIPWLIEQTKLHEHYRDELRFKIPLPPSILSPNSRIAPMHRSKVANEYKTTCAVLTKRALDEAGIKTFQYCIMHFQWVINTTRRGGAEVGIYKPQDGNNAVAALKHAIDGLIIGGIATDDNVNYVASGLCDLLRYHGHVTDRSYIECIVQGKALNAKKAKAETNGKP